MAKRKHLIVGSGSAGLSAAEAIRRLNSEDEIKIVTGEDYPPYSPTVLPYWLSGRIDETKLSMRQADYFNRLKATFAQGKEVIRIVPDAKEVVYKDGKKDRYDTLLIASGAKPVQPQIKGMAESGCLEFHTIDDCQKLLKELEGKNDVAVLGAGLVGMEVAIALVERGCQVTVIEKESRVLPLYFDKAAGSLIRGIFVSQGINLLTGTAVSEVSRRNGKVKIDLSEGSSISTDALVCCTGVKARTEFVKDSGIPLNQGIVVNGSMMTGIQDIYAAGDVAEAPDFFTGQYGVNQIIESAVDEGRVAGSNMAGVPAEYEGWLSSNIFNFFGNTAFSAGLSLPADDSYQVLVKKYDKGARFKKLVFDGDRLVGAMFLNIDLDPGVILYLLRQRVTLGDYQQRLFQQPREIARWLMLEAERRGASSTQG